MGILFCIGIISINNNSGSGSNCSRRENGVIAKEIVLGNEHERCVAVIVVE